MYHGTRFPFSLSLEQSRKSRISMLTRTMKIHALVAVLVISLFLHGFQALQLADFWLPEAPVLKYEENATTEASATTDAHSMTSQTAVAIENTSMALALNKTKQSRNSHPRSSVPRKVHANHSHDVDEFVGHLNALDPSESLSSCLMVMDDNFRLPEWLAYNYYAMNLRHLVILSDPAGRESPTNILDIWREYITIEEWTEKDYFDKDLRQRSLEMKGVKNPSPNASHLLFLERQSKFIKSCSLHLQKQNRTWISFHDIDEYYVINSDIVKGTKQRMEEPGSIIKLINELQKNATSTSDLVLPAQYSGPCVTTYRVPYSAVESSEEERGQEVPSFLDPRRLETLRWRNHAHPSKAIIGKSLVDVSKLPALKDMGWLDRKRTPFSPHKFIPSCPSVFYHPNAFIVLNHYLGSWEAYTYRANDPRKGNIKNRKEWEIYAFQKEGERGDDIRPWITGFVRLFGEQKVKRLLGNTGLLLGNTGMMPTGSTVSNETDASWQESNEFYLRRRRSEKKK
jgi:hypothetical protein